MLHCTRKQTTLSDKCGACHPPTQARGELKAGARERRPLGLINFAASDRKGKCRALYPAHPLALKNLASYDHRAGLW